MEINRSHGSFISFSRHVLLLGAVGSCRWWRGLVRGPRAAAVAGLVGSSIGSL